MTTCTSQGHLHQVTQSNKKALQHACNKFCGTLLRAWQVLASRKVVVLLTQQSVCSQSASQPASQPASQKGVGVAERIQPCEASHVGDGTTQEALDVRNR